MIGYISVREAAEKWGYLNGESISIILKDVTWC